MAIRPTRGRAPRSTTSRSPVWRAGSIERPRTFTTPSPIPDIRVRAAIIKEQRSELVKHHLWVLWTDYFKPPHFEKYPQLHTLFNEATKLAGASGTKGAFDAAKAQELLDKIDEIDKIFKETKAA